MEEGPSTFGILAVSYRIAEEDTPASGVLRVLRLSVEPPMDDRLGFMQADLSEYEEPQFNLKT
jgi:hypothetical protein